MILETVIVFGTLNTKSEKGCLPPLLVRVGSGFGRPGSLWTARLQRRSSSRPSWQQCTGQHPRACRKKKRDDGVRKKRESIFQICSQMDLGGDFFLIFIPFVASSRHRAAGPGVSGLGPGLRGGVQCRAKPEAGYELSLYSLAGPTSMATCLLHCRPRDGEAPCTVAQRLLYRDVPAAASHGTACWACQGSGCFGR